MTVGRLLRTAVSTSTTVATKGRLLRAAAAAAIPVGTKGRILRSASTLAVAPVVVPAPVGAVVPGLPLVLVAALADGTAASGATWSWRWVSGPVVAITAPAPGQAQITVPCSMTTQTLNVAVKATVGGVTSTEVQVVVTIPPHPEWALDTTSGTPRYVGVLDYTL